jgi:hypothetical protein
MDWPRRRGWAGLRCAYPPTRTAATQTHHPHFTKRVPLAACLAQWEVFRCTTCEQDPHNCLSEDLIRKTADAMVKWGFRDAGYTIVWIDDCWALKERNQTDGRLVPDPSRWPNGLKAVADYVHSLDMKLGLCECAGARSACVS